MDEKTKEPIESDLTSNEKAISDEKAPLGENPILETTPDLQQESRQISKANEPSQKLKDFKDEVKNFKKIVARTITLQIIKAVLIGLALAFPVYGLFALLDRFEATSLGLVWTLVTSIAVFIMASLVTFLALKQTSKSIAMRLDKDHKLSEKVQTMLAFRDEKGPMVDLQRQDANEAIGLVKNAIVGIKRLWVYILCFVLGLAMCIVCFMFNPIPEPEPEPPPEIPFKVSELQLTALSDLIAYVNASEMQDPYKSSVAQALTTLYEDIQDATTVTQRDEIIQKTMEEIYAQTDQSSGAVEVMNALWSTNTKTSRLLAKALNYYEWTSTNEWERFTEQIADFRAGFVHELATTEGADEQQITDDTKNALLSLSTSILTAFQSSEISNEDALYIVLNRLATAKEINADGTRIYGMTALAEYIIENGYTKTQRELDATVTGLNGDIYKALSQHQNNTDTGEYAMSTLASIFNIKAPEFKRPELQSSSSDSSSDGEGGGADGGISGGPSYGSDDKVYDPFTNRYVEYGTILDKYYSIMFSKLNGGSYTDEEKKALEEYFKILYGGFDKTENE